jgi:hypothetical protein
MDPPVARTPCVALALLPLLLACTSSPLRWPGFMGVGGTRITQEELRGEIDLLGSRFFTAVDATGDRIAAATADREVRRRTLLWRLRMLPLVETALAVGEPRQSYLGLLTLAVTQNDYLSEGEGRALFGPEQPLAVAEAERLEADARTVGAAFLTARDLERVLAEVERLAARHPIRGVFQAEAVVAGFEAADSRGTFRWVLDVPMAPFRALEGVDEGARAIFAFNQTARRFSDVVARLPEVMRWHVELLLYDVEDRETVVSGRESFALLAESAERFSQSAERLPAELRGESEALLADARESLAEVSTTLERTSAVSKELVVLAERAESAAEAWRAVVSEVRGPAGEPGAAAPEAERRPFDILDYERTAARIETAAGELRGLVAELRLLGESPGLEGSARTLGAAVDDARRAGRELVDLATRRALLLLAALFVGLSAWRRLETWLARRG